MAKGDSKSVAEELEYQEVSPVNTDELAHATYMAEQRVLEIQAKLHRWARDDPHRRFDDLFNLVADPAFLLVAWDQVRGNKGARTAGVDGRTAASIALGAGVGEFLDRLRTSLRDRSFTPMPVRERMIPKAGGKKRRLGIATVTSYCLSCSRVLGCFLDRCGAVLVRPSGPRSRVRDVSMAGGTDILGCLSVVGGAWCAGRVG